MDENGAVTMKEDIHDDTKETAQSHTSTPHISQASTAFTYLILGFDANADEPTKESDDVAEMLKGMKKKKSKKPKADDGEAEGGEGEGDGDAAADGGLDLSTMKKKKKKAPKEGAKDDFAAKIAALDINEKEGEVATAEKPVDEGDMEKGTGIWQHDETKAIGYELLLSRFFNLLAQKNPDHASSGSRSYKIPPPQCLREGNKKTIFANIAEICKRMKRTDEHVTSYLFAELGTSGSVDGSRRLVIKGRFQQKQIENVLRRYISKFLKFNIVRMLRLLTVTQWNMLPARPADLQTLNSTRERTDCISLPATPVVLDAVLLPLRLVSLHRSARGADSKVKRTDKVLVLDHKTAHITGCSRVCGSIPSHRLWACVPSRH